MNKNSLYLFGAVAAGFIYNRGHEFSFLIKYLLMIMLFFPLLKAAVPRDASVYNHALRLCLVMAGTSVTAYWLLKSWDKELATIVFLLIATPTATAAPVVIGLLNKNVTYVITAVVTTNLLSALSLPFTLGFIDYGGSHNNLGNMLLATMTVVGIPMLSAQLIRTYRIQLANRLTEINKLPFLIWLLVIYLATAKASDYLYSYHVSSLMLAKIALASLLTCGFNFLIGHYLGGVNYAVEGSQSLGQKNTMFMSWVALEYVSPLAALGPVCYLVFQNLYNSVLLNRK